MLNENETETNLSHLVIANLLKQSEDCLSLTKNEDTLCMAVNLDKAEYKTLTLTPSQRLYCDLLRMSEKSRYYLDNPQALSKKGKINLAKRCDEFAGIYSKVFCELWKKARENYDDIETLSNCLYETNQILPIQRTVVGPPPR